MFNCFHYSPMIFLESQSLFNLTDTGPKKVRDRTVFPFFGHFAPCLLLLRFSFSDTKSSARIRMVLKAPHSPVSVKKWLRSIIIENIFCFLLECDCVDKCRKDSKCRGFTFVTGRRNNCYIKTRLYRRRIPAGEKDIIFGIKFEK